MNISPSISDPVLGILLSQYTDVFSQGIGTMKDTVVSIKLKENVVPRFCKARPVPYALKDRIESELNRLIESGIYQPVSYSKWAAPIVPVMKDDGTVRICGDYKQTVNREAICDNYPVPKAEDLFARLNGGQSLQN